MLTCAVILTFRSCHSCTPNCTDHEKLYTTQYKCKKIYIQTRKSTHFEDFHKKFIQGCDQAPTTRSTVSVAVCTAFLTATSVASQPTRSLSIKGSSPNTRVAIVRCRSVSNMMMLSSAQQPQASQSTSSELQENVRRARSEQVMVGSSVQYIRSMYIAIFTVNTQSASWVRTHQTACVTLASHQRVRSESAEQTVLSRSSAQVCRENCSQKGSCRD